MPSPRRAVLFDIDGTLLRAGGAGREAMARGMAQTLALPLGQIQEVVRSMDFRGRTDAFLFEQLAGLLGRAEVNLALAVEAYLRALDDTLQESRIERLPGVEALITNLETRGDVHVGLLTGNVRRGAARKLRTIELEHLAQRAGGFGDDGRARHEVAMAAMARLAAQGLSASQVIVVGDTEHDVHAAHHAGARAVAVATGWTGLATLRTSGADHVLEDLTDPAELLALLG